MGLEQVDYEDLSFPGLSRRSLSGTSLFLADGLVRNRNFRLSPSYPPSVQTLFPSFSRFPATAGASLCFRISAGARFGSVSLSSARNIYKVRFSHVVYLDFYLSTVWRADDVDERTTSLMQSCRGRSDTVSNKPRQIRVHLKVYQHKILCGSKKWQRQHAVGFRSPQKLSKPI